MNGSDPIIAAILGKALGAFAGTVAALFYVPPKNWREFLARSVVSVALGVTLEPVGRQMLFMPDSFEGHIVGATVIAVGAWAIMGGLSKMKIGTKR